MQNLAMEQDHSVESDPIAPSPMKATRKKRIHRKLPERGRGESFADFARRAGTTKIRRAFPVSANGRVYDSLLKMVNGESKIRGKAIPYREMYNAFHGGDTFWKELSIRAADGDMEAVRLELAGKTAKPALQVVETRPERRRVSVVANLDGSVNLPGGFRDLQAIKEGALPVVELETLAMLTDMALQKAA